MGKENELLFLYIDYFMNTFLSVFLVDLYGVRARLTHPPAPLQKAYSNIRMKMLSVSVSVSKVAKTKTHYQQVKKLNKRSSLYILGKFWAGHFHYNFHGYQMFPTSTKSFLILIGMKFFEEFVRSE